MTCFSIINIKLGSMRSSGIITDDTVSGSSLVALVLSSRMLCTLWLTACRDTPAMSLYTYALTVRHCPNNHTRPISTNSCCIDIDAPGTLSAHSRYQIASQAQMAVLVSATDAFRPDLQITILPGSFSHFQPGTAGTK